ncbi:MAG: metal-dependent transcriptional regulator [Clostridia bacterium]|nr:metal-dependent transcriptional regulator [Clostridia bacterium]
MIIKESAENYLETIYVLSKRIGAVRSIDVANEMNFSKPSVSVKMKQFRENGYINMDKDGIISLTDKGMEIATHVYERHEIIAHVLMILGVSEETAYEDSCKIEHDLSDESFEKIKEFYYKNKKRWSLGVFA